MANMTDTWKAEQQAGLLRKLDFCLEHAPSDAEAVIPIGGTLESLRADIVGLCECAAFDRQQTGSVLKRNDKLLREVVQLTMELEATRKLMLAEGGACG
jgi:hypothetical protein